MTETLFTEHCEASLAFEETRLLGEAQVEIKVTFPVIPGEIQKGDFIEINIFSDCNEMLTSVKA